MVTFSMTLNGPWRSYELQYESNGFSHFPNTFIKLFEKHFPFVRLSKKRMKNKQWITKGLKKSSKQKNKLYKKWLSTKNREDEINYKECRKRFSQLCRQAELQYYKTMFDLRTNNVKQLWKNLTLFVLLITINGNQNLCQK